MQYDPETIRQAMRMAQSPQGQQLIRMLQASGGDQLQKALSGANSGDYEAVKKALSGILSDPEAQKLLRQMGGNHGTDGR